MIKKALIILVLGFAVPAYAQQAQQADPDFMQRAIVALQQQRNEALDKVAASEAKLSKSQEDLNKANLQIKGLQDKYESKKDESEKK